MRKSILRKAVASAQSGYTWSMYFFKIDRRNKKQPFTATKIRFKNNSYLDDYTAELLWAVAAHQIEPLTDVQQYDGFNTKSSCDRITTGNPLIAQQWEMFSGSLACASDAPLPGKTQGYALCGQPTKEGDCKPIILVKLANPVITLENKRSVAYKSNADHELDMISDTLYRFYLTVDFIVYNANLYAFGHAFETLFDIEKTLQKVKMQSIQTIVKAEIFADASQFQHLAKQYHSPRTFLTLNEKRLLRIQNESNRIRVAEKFHLKLDESNQFKIDTMREASLLIKYLCYKVFCDDETQDILEASSVIRLELTGA